MPQLSSQLSITRGMEHALASEEVGIYHVQFAHFAYARMIMFPVQFTTPGLPDPPGHINN